MHDWLSSSSSSVLFNVLVMTNKVSRYGNKWWLKLFYWIWKWMLSPNLYIFKDLMLCKYKLILITNYFSFFQTVLTKIKILWALFVVLTFERQSHVTWAGLELIIYPSIGFNSSFSWLYLSSAGITGLGHNTQLKFSYFILF